MICHNYRGPATQLWEVPLNIWEVPLNLLSNLFFNPEILEIMEIPSQITKSQTNPHNSEAFSEDFPQKNWERASKKSAVFF